MVAIVVWSFRANPFFLMRRCRDRKGSRVMNGMSRVMNGMSNGVDKLLERISKNLKFAIVILKI